MYKILILPLAEEDLAYMKKNDKNSYIKCFDILRAMIQEPRVGIGKPERLKYFDKEVYSRRINHKDRIIYTIYEKEKEIDVSSCRGHYAD